MQVIGRSDGNGAQVNSFDYGSLVYPNGGVCMLGCVSRSLSLLCENGGVGARDAISLFAFGCMAQYHECFLLFAGKIFFGLVDRVNIFACN